MLFSILLLLLGRNSGFSLWWGLGGTFSLWFDNIFIFFFFRSIQSSNKHPWILTEYLISPPNRNQIMLAPIWNLLRFPIALRMKSQSLTWSSRASAFLSSHPWFCTSDSFLPLQPASLSWTHHTPSHLWALSSLSPLPKTPHLLPTPTNPMNMHLVRLMNSCLSPECEFHGKRNQVASHQLYAHCRAHTYSSK